jgi:quercetin 2,3-dioxygenase
MITLRPAAERGHANHGWLDSRHSFSFADYHDPAHMGFGPLRVINEDRVAPGKGFGTHGHRDMEIISYVLAGALEHKDSLGNGSIMTPGDVQRMSAGRGVLHSEFNPSADSEVHFLQVWIEPAVRGVVPSYEQLRFEPAAKRGRLALIASPDGADGSVRMHQDARVYAGLFDGAESATYSISALAGAATCTSRAAPPRSMGPLAAGDALRLTGDEPLRIDSGRDAEILVFDLP